MDGNLELDSPVAQRDRLSIDIGDLREEIESCRNDASWRELPLGSKIRVLVRERLDEIAEERSRLPAPNFRCLLIAHHDRLVAHPKIKDRLQALMDGEPPTEAEKLRIALEVGVSEETIDKLLSID